MKRVLMCSVFSVVCAGSANAGNNTISGQYGFTGTAVCLVAPGHVGDANVPPQVPNPTPGTALTNSGFNAILQPNDVFCGGGCSPGSPGSPSQNFSDSYSVIGIRTFNGDGTGSVKGTTVSVTVRPTPGPNGFPHFPPSAASTDFSFNFTYTVDGNGGWKAAMVPGSYTATHTTGPRSHFNPANPADQTSTVDAIPPVTGMISKDGKTLIAAHDTPTVETHTYSNGDVDPQICHRSRVFILLN